MARPNLMESKDTFMDAVEALLEDWKGEGSEEDVLEQAMGMSADAEHGKRLRFERKRMRGEHDMPQEGAPSEESAEPCPECGETPCACGELPDMEG
jgi:hypothetical protein